MKLDYFDYLPVVDTLRGGWVRRQLQACLVQWLVAGPWSFVRECFNKSVEIGRFHYAERNVLITNTGHASECTKNVNNIKETTNAHLFNQ